MKTSVKCVHGHVSETFTPTVTLDIMKFEEGDCVGDLILRPVIDRVSDYTCDVCASETDCDITTSLDAAKETLIVYIPRFSKNSFRKKTTKLFNTPEVTIMGQIYYLCSVIEHRGTSIRQGHYVSYILDKKGVWYLTNDEQAYVVSADTAINAEGYLLFYVKRDIQASLNAAVKDQREHVGRNPLTKGTDQSEISLGRASDKKIPQSDSDDNLDDIKFPQSDSDNDIVDKNFPPSDSDDEIDDKKLPQSDSDDYIVDKKFPQSDSDDDFVDKKFPQSDSDDDFVAPSGWSTKKTLKKEKNKKSKKGPKKRFKHPAVAGNLTKKNAFPSCRCPAMKRKHWHCPRCEYISDRRVRLPAHLRSKHDESQRQAGVFLCKLCDHTSQSNRNLQRHMKQEHLNGSEECLRYVKVQKNLFLVQTEDHGPQRPIHVLYGEDETGCITAECTNNSCKEISQGLRRSDKTVKLCKHIKSLQNSANEICIAFKDVNEETVKNLKQFSAEHKEGVVLPLMEQARKAGHRLAVPFNTGGTYWYFSVYDNNTTAHWYCHYNRLVVSYNSLTGSYICSCKKSKFCKHVAVAMATMSCIKDIDGHEKFPSEDLTHCQQTKTNESKDEMLNYLSKKDLMKDYTEKLPKEGEILKPSETKCFVCDQVLVDDDTEERVEVLDPLVSGLEVIVKSKICKCCDMTFQYNETCDGVFRFRRKLYSNSLMNRCYVALTTSKQSFEAHVDYLNEIYKRNFDYKTLMSAFFSFAGYFISHCLGNKTTFSCNQCGYYPRILIADVQRCMNFSTRFQNIEKGSMYLKMDDLVSSINRPGMAEALYGTKSSKMNLCEQLPVIGSCNLLDQPPPYLRHIKSCPRPEKAIFPEVFLDRLETYCQEEPWKLDTLLKELGISITGSKDDKIEAILKSGNFELFQKVFPRVYGKSGGLLRFICPHGLTYLTKFLVRAEGSTDYAEVLMSLMHPPNLFVCDFVAEVIASVLKHQPDFFPPFNGFLGDPTDGRLLETLNNRKSLDKSDLISIPCLDPGFVQSSNTLAVGEHPVTGSSSRYGCIDKWHERCHKKTPVRCLLSLNSVQQTTHLNSEAAEQQNFSISTIKRHTKKLRADRHMKLVLLTLIKQNEKKNGAYKKKLENQTTMKFKVDPNFGWLVPADSPQRPFPTFVIPNPIKKSNKLVIPEVLVHPGNQAVVGSSVFMVSLPDMGGLEEFNLAIAILFYCGLDTYFVSENSHIPIELIKFKDMLRGKYSPQLHSAAGHRFFELSGLSSEATATECLRKLIELIQFSEGCPEISDKESPTCDWLLSTNYSTKVQSFDKLHCFVAKKQLFVNVGNTFYCIKSGIRIVIEKRIFNDWSFELDFGMIKRLTPKRIDPLPQPSNISDSTSAPISSPITHSTPRKQAVKSTKKNLTALDVSPITTDSVQQARKKTLKRSLALDKETGPNSLPQTSYTSDNTSAHKKRAVTSAKPQIINLGVSPAQIYPEEDMHAGSTSPASFNDLLDENKDPVKQALPDKTTLICCSTTTVFGINVGLWMEDKLLRKAKLNGDLIDACCLNLILQSGASNINYLDSLMITDLLSKLARCNIITASLLKQLQRVKFFNDDITLFVVNINRNHWILTAIIPSKKMVVFLNPSKVGSTKSSVFPVFKLLQRICLLECGSTLTQLDYRFHCPEDLNNIQEIGDTTECGVICLIFVHVMCFRSQFPRVCDQFWLNNFRVYLFNGLLRCQQTNGKKRSCHSSNVNLSQIWARRVEESQIILKDFQWTTIPLEAGGVCSGRSTKAWMKNIMKILSYDKPLPLRMDIFDF